MVRRGSYYTDTSPSVGEGFSIFVTDLEPIDPSILYGKGFDTNRSIIPELVIPL